MKQLLLLSSLLTICLAISCQNKHVSNAEATEQTEAPPHNAPDQALIDSLKQEKLKDKIKK